MRVLAVVLCLAGLLATTAGGATKKWYWTEAHAERAVLASVRIPCKRVWSPSDRRCNIAAAQAVYDTDSSVDDSTCDARIDPVSVANCKITIAESVAYARAALRHARIGYSLKTANCVGSDEKGSSFTFARFRCKVVTEGDIADGRIGVFVTGPAKFRWLILS